MRRITLWLLSTIAGLVLLFSYRPNTTVIAQEPTIIVTSDAPTASPQATPTTSTPTTSTPTMSTTSTYDGSLVQTDQGPVQIRMTVANGRITDIEAIAYPSDSQRHREISERALPILRADALQAQSANIDTVSGATDTSTGYTESLQAAIDQAHLS